MAQLNTISGCIVCKTTQYCLPSLHINFEGHHEAPRGNDEVETGRNNKKQRETGQTLEMFATRYLCVLGDSVVCETMGISKAMWSVHSVKSIYYTLILLRPYSPL
jgi:hypothetical protein